MEGTGNKVEKVVGTRTSTQARSHAQKVLPHPNSGEGISTSTTITKNSPSSNKTGDYLEFKKPSSVWSDDNNSEFAIFKVEKIRKPLPGRSRVNSENNVFSMPVDPASFGEDPARKSKAWNRKYSMNIDYNNPPIDLMNSPIKETIKEQNFEDDEEEKYINPAHRETPLLRHNTFEPKAPWVFKDDRIFLFQEENEEMNLEDPSDIHMEISNGPASKFYSLDPLVEEVPRSKDIRMEQEGDSLLNMEVDMEGNYSFFNQQPNTDGFLS